MRETRASDLFFEQVKLKGRRVLDIGCGDGALVRLMTERGARVTGLECQPDQMARALAAPKAGDEDYAQAGAEAIPFPDASIDLVVFMNSLHHLPPPLMDQGLREAARVLTSDGVLYVSEPLAEGAFYQLSKQVDDEGVVRRLAHEALIRAPGHGLAMERETVFLHPMSVKSFEDFRARILAANPERAPAFDAIADRLRDEFKRAARPSQRGFGFLQPSRANLFVRK